MQNCVLTESQRTAKVQERGGSFPCVTDWLAYKSRVRVDKTINCLSHRVWIIIGIQWQTIIIMILCNPFVCCLRALCRSGVLRQISSYV